MSRRLVGKMCSRLGVPSELKKKKKKLLLLLLMTIDDVVLAPLAFSPRARKP